MNAPMVPPTQSNPQRWIENAEAQRDLKNQLAGLDQMDEQEIQFIEWSPGRRMVTIWNMESGEEHEFPRYQALAALNIQNPRTPTGYQWTAHKENAPEPHINSVKCFLHPEAPERELLNEIGIFQTCTAGQLANQSAKRAHAKRHASSWEQYQEEVARREKEAEKQAQASQTAAILKLAGEKAK